MQVDPFSAYRKRQVVGARREGHATGSLDRLALDGGPLLAVTGTLYVLTFTSSYLARGQMFLCEWVGVPETAIQLSTPAIVLWSWVVFRCSREPVTAPAPDESTTLAPGTLPSTA